MYVYFVWHESKIPKTHKSVHLVSKLLLPFNTQTVGF